MKKAAYRRSIFGMIVLVLISIPALGNAIQRVKTMANE